MLAAILLARGALDRPAGAPRPRFALLHSAAMPKPFEPILAEMGQRSDGCGFPTLHTLSEADRINPPEMGAQLAKWSGPQAEVLWHGGGHVVPVDEKSLASVREFLERQKDCLLYTSPSPRDS